MSKESSSHFYSDVARLRSHVDVRNDTKLCDYPIYRPTARSQEGIEVCLPHILAQSPSRLFCVIFRPSEIIRSIQIDLDAGLRACDQSELFYCVDAFIDLTFVCCCKSVIACEHEAKLDVVLLSIQNSRDNGVDK